MIQNKRSFIFFYRLLVNAIRKESVASRIIKKVKLRSLFKLSNLLLLFFLFIFKSSTMVYAYTSIYNKDNVSRTPRFVSTNLCIDRLLLALANVEQIAAVSKVAFDPMVALKVPDDSIHSISATIESLLPYRDDIILIDPSYQKRLFEQLQRVNFNLFVVELPRNPKELEEIIEKIANLTNQPVLGKNLKQLISQEFPQFHKEVLALEEGLVVSSGANISQLFKLLGFENSSAKLDLSRKKIIDIETLLTTKVDLLLLLKWGDSFSKASSYLSYPGLQKKLNLTNKVYLPSKYQLCFDQGLWIGAREVLKELNKN